MEMKKAAIYSRLSVNRTGETLAVERQQRDCRELVERNGWQVVASYVDDNKSAWHEHSKRPGYEALCEAIRRGDIDVVVVYETDRLARRLRPMLDLFDLLLETGVVVHSVKSGMVALDSPMNIANAQMKAVFAEQYVNDARDKNLRARLEAARSGKRHMTSRPYGWEDDGITVRESEAAIIREITDRLIDGETGTRIAHDLNVRKVPTVKGAQWTAIGVKQCARRASNAGLRSHHGQLYDGTWQAIVTRETWERCQTVLERPVTAFKRGKGRRYAFTGFVVCGVCKTPLGVAMGRSNAGDASYRCDGKRRGVETVRTGCGGVQRSQVPVDWLIKEAIIDRLDGGALEDAFAQLASSDKAVSGVLEELREARLRLDSLVDDYASGLLSREQLARAKGVTEAQVKDLERQAASLSGNATLNRADFSQGIRAVIEGADLYLLRDLAELLIKEVRIYPQAKTGFTVKLMEIDGRRYRFDMNLVEIDWLI